MLFRKSLEYFRKVSGVQISEGRPEKINNNIQPTIDLSPKISEVLFQTSASTSGNMTISGLDISRDFYITSISFSFIKDEFCDAATANIGLNIQTSGKNIIFGANILTLTAQDKTMIWNFNYPLKIDRVSSITTTTNSFTVGTMLRSATITGYYL